MPINLNKLNISLDQFNAVSNGKYNIGQLKLSDDGASVYRTNNHKTLTFLNTTKISPDEALAVKFAFCNALKNGGLDADRIKAIKVKLGIPRSSVEMFKALSTGSVKPLTAEDVRSIIDENVRAGAFKSETMESLRATKGVNEGVSKETMDSRAATREKINNRTFENNRTSMENNTVNYMLNIMEYSKKSETIPSNYEKGFAQIFKKAIDNEAFDNENAVISLTHWPLKLSHSKNGNITATITFDDGKELALSTGLKREELQKKLDAFIAAGTGDGAKTQVKEKKGVAADGASGKAETQVNAKETAMKAAESIVKKYTDAWLPSLQQECRSLGIKDSGGLEKLWQHGMKRVFANPEKNPLPIVDGKLDSKSFESRILNDCFVVSQNIKGVLNKINIKMNILNIPLDNKCAQNIIDTLFDENGKRNETSVERLVLRTPEEENVEGGRSKVRWL